MQVHVHPRSGVVIEGVRLPPGSILRANDKYDSSDGKWREWGYAIGLIIRPGCETYWVRQPGPLSENARILLGYLHLSPPWGSLSCIGERNGSFYVIPSPTFNWDGRFDMESKRVLHPECVQELVDHGYLQFAAYDARNWISDYSTVWEGHENQVYTLTDEGKLAGARLLPE